MLEMLSTKSIFGDYLIEKGETKAEQTAPEQADTLCFGKGTSFLIQQMLQEKPVANRK